MKNQTKMLWISICMLIMTSIISSCGPGKLFGPTFTPSPSPTITPTLPAYRILGSFKASLSAVVFYCIYQYDEGINLPVDMDKCYSTKLEIYVNDIQPGKYNLAILPMDFSTMQAGYPRFLINENNELRIIIIETNKLTILGELDGSQFTEMPFMSHGKLIKYSG